MSYEPKLGSAVAWAPRAPNHPLSIKCVAHRAIAEGEEFEVAVWANKEKKNEKGPDYSGNVQDKWVPQGQNNPVPQDVPAPDGDLNDDIPF